MNEDFRDLLIELLDAEVRFLVVGAHAMAVHGVPRATGDLDYNDAGAQAYEERYRARTLRNLSKRAKQLGLALVNVETGELLHGAVS